MKTNQFWTEDELAIRNDQGFPCTKRGDLPKLWRLSQHRNRVFVFEIEGHKVRFCITRKGYRPLASDTLRGIARDLFGSSWTQDPKRQGQIMTVRKVSGAWEMDPPKSTLERVQDPQHKCAERLPYRIWGDAVEYCVQDADGRFWIGNKEYESQALFCPFCGAKAPNQTPAEPEEE